MGILDSISGGNITAPGSLPGTNDLIQQGRGDIQLGNASAGIGKQIVEAGNITQGRIDKATGVARDRSDRSFDSSLGILSRVRRARTGGEGGLDAGEQRRVNLRRSLGRVDASNRTMAGLLRDRDTARVGATGIVDFLSGQASSAAEGAAESEAGREIQFQKEQAEAARSRLGSIGQIAAIVAAPFTGGASLALLGAT